jgi:NAD(P)H-dependent flavin oxidoreductase YrpB (nitropropane dioxygenase family)
MLRTPLCDLLGISVPIVLAPFGPWDQVDLAAAVCGSGALGSLGTAIRSPAELREQLGPAPLPDGPAVRDEAGAALRAGARLAG